MHYSNKKFSLKIIFSLSFVLFFTSVKLIAQPLVVDGGLHQTICEGASVVIGGSPTANYGSPGYTYLWAPAAGLSSTTVSNPTASPTTTTTYTIQVTDAVLTVATATVTITVNPLPTVNPTVSASMCNGSVYGGTTFFSTPGGATFTWTNSNPAIGLPASGVGNVPSFTLTNPGSTTYGGNIVVTATLAGCTGPGYMYNITVKPTPIASSPLTDTRCSGVNCNFPLSSTVVGTTFSWTTTGSGVTGNTASSGTVISQSVTTTGPVAGTASYVVTPIAAGCVGSTINPVLTVNPIPTATATTSPLTRCSGDTVSFAVTSNVAGTTFTWSSFATNTTGADASGTGTYIFDTLTATTAAAGTMVYVFTPVAAGCTGSQAIPFVNVNPIPVVTATPSSPSICSGDNTSINLSSTVSGTTYSWISSMVTNITGESASGTSASINDVLTCSFAATGSVVYEIIPTAAGCSGLQLNTTVTVNPIPTMAAFPSTYSAICSGGLVSVSFSSTPAGATYSWTATESNTSGTTLIGTGSISDFISTVLPSPGTSTYTITPSYAGCAGTPLVYPINVNPTPDATFTLVSPACQFAPNIFPSFSTGTAGVFSSMPAGLVFANTLTGEIDLTASTPGSYNITNTIAAAGGCSMTFYNLPTAFVISPYYDATITDIPTVCNSVSPFNFSAASIGGTWSGSGITSSVAGTFNAALAGIGTHTITYTPPGICSPLDTTVIVVTGGDIDGKVTYSGGDLNTGLNTAVLFDYSSTMSSFDTVQVSSIDGLGYYHFPSVLGGDYLVKVFADTLVHPLVVPSYYANEYLWDSATVYTHGCLTDTANVLMSEGIVGVGPGMISGNVSEGAGFVRTPGDPIPGLDVKLGKNPGGAMIGSTQTNIAGDFDFTNLGINAPGEYYTIYVDIPGLGRDSVYNIHITATDTIFTMMDHLADSNSVYPVYPVNVSVASHGSEEVKFIVYPNPTNTSSTVAYTLTSNNRVQLDVYNVLGKKVESLVNENQSAGDHKVNLTKLEAGIYFITLNINNNSNTTRLMVID